MTGIYFLCQLMSTFAAESISAKNRPNVISTIRKNMKMGFTNNLPEISINGIMVNGQFAKTGTIVVRTLSKSFVTELINEYHYGIVIGTDVNNVEYIIEMTMYKNVNILSKSEFLNPYDESHFKIYGEPLKDFLPTDVYKRAEKFEYEEYSLLNLNCIDFSKYCIYDIEPQRRSDKLNTFVLKMNELGQKMNDLYAKQQKDPVMKEFFEERSEKLKHEQKIISDNIKNKTID